MKVLATPADRLFNYVANDVLLFDVFTAVSFLTHKRISSYGGGPSGEPLTV